MAIRTKPFEAVQMMHSIREKPGTYIKDMTFEQERGRTSFQSQTSLRRIRRRYLRCWP